MSWNGRGVVWPYRCLGESLATFWNESWGGLGTVLERLGTVLGRLGAVLERLGAVLDVLW